MAVSADCRVPSLAALHPTTIAYTFHPRNAITVANITYGEYGEMGTGYVLETTTFGRNRVAVGSTRTSFPGLKQPWALGRDRFAVKTERVAM
jgi:hypothetical protein